MPLARIITRHPEDAHALHQYLVELGYDVELADPSAPNLAPADLEVDLDRMPIEDALAVASEWAEAAGADVYVVPGALAASGSVARHAQAEPSTPPPVREPVAEISTFTPAIFPAPEPQAEEEAPPKREIVRETLAQAAGIFSDSLHETKQAVSRSFSEMKERVASARERRASEPSRLQRWNQSLAEWRAGQEHKRTLRREAARVAREQRALREARAAGMARELRERIARETAARAAVARPSVAAVPREQFVARTQPQAAERRASPPRRGSQRDEGAEYWRGAFTGAAVVAILLMVAWATLGTSSPPDSTNGARQIKQEMPFGPVTLAPNPPPARPPASPVTTPVTHTVTPPPKPAPVISHPTRRAARQNDVAPDEVIVHHYAPAPPRTSATTTARNAGPKRISDQ